MRNPDRIDEFMAELGKVWKENFPDWRFGQLMFNFLSEVGDPFYWEEDMFLKKFNEYVEKLNGKKG